jgi:hypothetical protein
VAFDHATVVRACVINGTKYERGDVIPWDEAKTFLKLDVMLSSRILELHPDPHGRRVQSRHPAPTRVPTAYLKKP